MLAFSWQYMKIDRYRFLERDDPQTYSVNGCTILLSLSISGVESQPMTLSCKTSKIIINFCFQTNDGINFLKMDDNPLDYRYVTAIIRELTVDLREGLNTEGL